MRYREILPSHNAESNEKELENYMATTTEGCLGLRVQNSEPEKHSDLMCMKCLRKVPQVWDVL